MTGPTIDVGISASVDKSVNAAAHQTESTFKRLNNTLKGVAKTGSLIAKGTTQGLKKTNAAAQQARREFEELRKSMEKLYFAGLHLSLIGGVITGLGVFPIAAASKFEAEMSKVLAVTDGAKENFVALNQVASELGRTTQFTATQAAEGLTFLGMAGFEANEAISALPATLNLALVGGLELGRAADIVTNTVQAMRLSVGDLGHVTDTLSNTITSSNVNMEQLADTLKYVATPAQAAGIDIDTLTATIGALGNAGIQSSLAGTNLRAVIISLAAPTKKAKDTLDKLGVSISYTEEGALDLFQTMEDLRDANFSLADATAIFQRRAATSALAIAGQVDAVRELASANKDAAGATKEMAKIMQDNVKGVILRITSAFDGLMRAVAKGAMGPIKLFGDAFAKLISAMAAGIEMMGPFSGIILGLVTTFGSLITVLGITALAYGTYGRAVTTLTEMLGANTLLVRANAASHASVLLAQTKTTASMTLMQAAGIRLTAMFTALKGAIIQAAVALKVAFISNPVGVAIAAIATAMSAVLFISTRMVKKYSELSTASIKYTNTIMTQRETYIKLLDAYKKTEDGTKEQEKAAIALRGNIDTLIVSQGSLGIRASWAASALDKESDAIYGVDDALAMLKASFNDQIFISFGDAITMALEQYGELEARLNVSTVFRNTSATIRKFREEMSSAVAPVIAQAGIIIENLSSIGAIDMTAGVEEFISLLPKAAQLKIKASPELLGGITEAYKKVQKEILSINEDITKDDRKSREEQLSIAVKRYEGENAALEKVIKTVNKYREAQASADGSDVDRATKAKLAGLEKASLLYERNAKTIRNMNRIEIDGIDEVARVRTNALAKATRLGIQSKEEEELRTLAIEYDMAKKTVAIREQAVAAMEGKQFEGMGRNAEEAFKKVVDAAKESRDAMEEIGMKAGEAYAKSLGASLDKAKEQFRDYIKIVDEANAKILSIEQTTADAIRDVRQKLMTDEQKRRDDLAQSDKQAAELQQQYLDVVNNTIPKIKELMAAGKSDEASKETEKLRDTIGEIQDKAKDTIGDLKGLSVKDKGEEAALIRRIEKIKETATKAATALKGVGLAGGDATSNQIDSISKKLADLTLNPKDIKLNVVLVNAEEAENKVNAIRESAADSIQLKINVSKFDEDISALREKMQKEAENMQINITASEGTIAVIKDVNTGITSITDNLNRKQVLSVDAEGAKRVISEVISKIDDEFPNGKKIVTLVVKTVNQGKSDKPPGIGFNTGGKVPGGFGGGDKVRAWLEPGEQVIDKYTSRALGDAFFSRLRSMSSAASALPSTIFEYIGQIGKSARMVAAQGMQSGGKVTARGSNVPMLGQIDLRVGTRTFPVMADRSVAEELQIVLQRESMVRSN